MDRPFGFNFLSRTGNGKTQTKVLVLAPRGSVNCKEAWWLALNLRSVAVHIWSSEAPSGCPKIRLLAVTRASIDSDHPQHLKSSHAFQTLKLHVAECRWSSCGLGAGEISPPGMSINIKRRCFPMATGLLPLIRCYLWDSRCSLRLQAWELFGHGLYSTEGETDQATEHAWLFYFIQVLWCTAGMMDKGKWTANNSRVLHRFTVK